MIYNYDWSIRSLLQLYSKNIIKNDPTNQDILDINKVKEQIQESLMPYTIVLNKKTRINSNGA